MPEICGTCHNEILVQPALARAYEDDGKLCSYGTALCDVQPSAVESLEYFLGGAHDTAADRIAAWIPSQRDMRPF
jgi:hypothetical protein